MEKLATRADVQHILANRAQLVKKVLGLNESCLVYMPFDDGPARIVVSVPPDSEFSQTFVHIDGVRFNIEIRYDFQPFLP